MIENKELAIAKEKIQGMSQMIATTKVENDQDVADISDKIKNVKRLGKYIKDVKDKFVAPAKEIIDQAKELYDPLIKECLNAETILKQKAEVYLTEKEAQRKADELKIAKKVESGYIKPETAIEKMENLEEAPKTITTMNSTLNMSKRKVAEISDPSLIPDEYWIIDETRVRKEALEREKNGTEQIPGVIIKEVASIRSL